MVVRAFVVKKGELITLLGGLAQGLGQGLPRTMKEAIM